MSFVIPVRFRGLVVLIAAGFGLGVGNGSAHAQVVQYGKFPSVKKSVRVGTVQTKPRLIDYRIKDPAAVLAGVDGSLGVLEQIIHKAGAAGCDALAFPEDTLGLLNWVGVNEELARQVLPEAVTRMLDRLGRAAARHRMYLVVCSDFIESDGATYNTAFFLGRDGKEIGRYHKVCPTYTERLRQPGKSLPVFKTPDLGTVGMLICYDMVMPETARCLALAGADIIFIPTMGGAAIGEEDDLGLQAMRVRAVENFVYLAVAFRGGGAMIISPQGKILARAEGPDGIAIADIDPFGGREGGDSMNYQRDMRARLFRERTPAAFGILSDPNPPVLSKVPINLTTKEAAGIMARVLTVGEDEFRAADSLARAGKIPQAIAAFQRLRAEYRDSWIDRVSRQRLEKLVTLATKPEPVSNPLFSEGFDASNLHERGWYDGGTFTISEKEPFAGKGCIEYTWKSGTTTPASSSGVRHLFDPSGTVFLRFYIKLSKGWGWSGRPYHPHLMHFMTTENSKYHGPASSHLTVYIEPWNGRLRLAAQDIQNKDMPHGLTQGPLRGGYNGSFFDSRDVLFDDDRWHCVEAMFQLNSLDLANDRPNSDGIIRGWFDGKLVIDRTDVVLRSTDFPRMKFNQFLLTPYFGPGLLPHEQTLWIDELAVGTKRLGPLTGK